MNGMGMIDAAEEKRKREAEEKRLRQQQSSMEFDPNTLQPVTRSQRANDLSTLLFKDADPTYGRTSGQLPTMQSTAKAPTTIEQGIARMTMAGTKKAAPYGGVESLSPEQQQQLGRAKFASGMAEAGGKMFGRLGADMSPGLGEGLSAYDTMKSYDEGNYGMMAVNSLGMVPLAGSLVRVAKTLKGAATGLGAARGASKSMGEALGRIVSGAPTGAPPALSARAQVEMVPGNLWGQNTSILEAYPGTRLDYTATAAYKAGAPALREIERTLGLKGTMLAEADAAGDLKPQIGFGGYQGQGNANLSVAIPDVLPDGTKLTSEGTQALLHAIAYVTRQNAVPVMRPRAVKPQLARQLAGLPPAEAAAQASAMGAPALGGVGFTLQKMPSAGEVEAIAAALKQGGLAHGFTITNDAQLLFGNFTGSLSDSTLHKEVLTALQGDATFSSLVKPDARPYYYRFDGEYAGDLGPDGHLARLAELAELERGSGVDAGAGGIATRLSALLGHDPDRWHKLLRTVDDEFEPAARLDQSIASELKRTGVTPAAGLDQPYNTRGLHRSMLMRGDASVPLLGPNGKPPRALLPAGTNANTTGRALDNIDGAFGRTPEPLKDEASWKQWGSELFGPVIPKPPSAVTELGQAADQIATGAKPSGLAGQTFQRQRDLLSVLDNGAGGRSTMGALSDEGLKGAEEFGELYRQGKATPEHSLALLLWGALSRRMSVAPHETAFLDLWQSGNLEPALTKAAAGQFTKADADAMKALVPSMIQEGSFARSNISNANDLGSILAKMSQPSRVDPTKNNAQVWHELMGSGQLDDKDLLKEFQRHFAGEGIGIDNKVAAFTGLVAGRKGNAVMDRVQTANLWNAERDFPEIASNFYEGSGVSGLMQGPQGYAVQRAIQETLPKGIDALYKSLGRENPGLGGYHWESWVSASGQEVKHGSTEVLKRHALGSKNPAEGVSVTEGQYDTFKYGGINGVLGGEKVWGHTTSDGKVFVMDKTTFAELTDAFRKLMPKGVKVSDAKSRPYYELKGYPADQRDALIRSKGMPAPTPPPQPSLRDALRTRVGAP